MSYELYFGKHKGKSYEWLFFHDPGYARDLFDSTSQGTWRWRSREEMDYFMELHHRANNLTGANCEKCKQRPFTRMVPYGDYPKWEISAVSFYCDECGYLGVTARGPLPPAFFLLEGGLPKWQHLIVVDAIRRVYIPGRKLTQKKMEDFFGTDHFLVNATPGFFDEYKEEEA